MESREFLPKCLFSARRLQLILVEFYTRTLQLAGPTQCCRIAESNNANAEAISKRSISFCKISIFTPDTSQDPPRIGSGEWRSEGGGMEISSMMCHVWPDSHVLRFAPAHAPRHPLGRIVVLERMEPARARATQPPGPSSHSHMPLPGAGRTSGGRGSSQGSQHRAHMHVRCYFYPVAV